MKSLLIAFAGLVFAAISTIGLSHPPVSTVPSALSAENLVGLPDQPGQSGFPSSPLVAGSPAGLSTSLKPQVGAAGDMIGFSHSDGSGSQTITLVNTSKSWMAVYHIDRSGKIRLASSRPIDADFTLQLNATAPLPDEIRRMDRR